MLAVGLKNQRNFDEASATNLVARNFATVPHLRGLRGSPFDSLFTAAALREHDSATSSESKRARTHVRTRARAPQQEPQAAASAWLSLAPPAASPHTRRTSATVSTTARHASWHSRTSCKRLLSAAKSRSSSACGAGRCTRRRWRQRRSSGVGSGSPGPTPTRTTPSLAPAHWRRLVQLVQRRAPRAPVQRPARRRTRAGSPSPASVRRTVRHSSFRRVPCTSTSHSPEAHCTHTKIEIPIEIPIEPCSSS